MIWHTYGISLKPMTASISLPLCYLGKVLKDQRCDYVNIKFCT